MHVSARSRRGHRIDLPLQHPQTHQRRPHNQYPISHPPPVQLVQMVSDSVGVPIAHLDQSHHLLLLLLQQLVDLAVFLAHLVHLSLV